jgi:hypothetical protein
MGRNVADYFDLIVGTSTGGIIALGLGLGYSAKEMLAFYEKYGPEIFKGSRFLRALRHVVLTKYDPAPLRNALKAEFGDRALGESKKRLVIPSCDLDTGEVYIWKTAHHVRFEHDYKQRVVDVALATAAAPSYFPSHRLAAGTPLIDGGVWANNPVAVAVVEAIGILKWNPDDLRILSLGCTAAPLDINAGSWGWARWGPRLASLFTRTQSSAAIGTAQHLLTNRDNLVRICPSVGRRFGLDAIPEIPSLKGLGNSEARKQIDLLRPMFFAAPAEPFEPFHSV